MSLKWIFNFFFLFLHLLLTSTWHMWIREALLENIWLDWRDGEGRIFLWRQPAVDLTSGESLVQSSPEHIHSVMPQRTALVWLVYNSSAYSEDPFQLHISNSDAIAMVIFMSRRFSGVRNRCSRSLPFTTLWIRGSRPASRPALHRALLTFPISPPHLRLIPSGGSGCRAGDPGFAKHGCGVQPGCSELPEGLGFLPGIVQNQCRRCDGGGGGRSRLQSGQLLYFTHWYMKCPLRRRRGGAGADWSAPPALPFRVDLRRVLRLLCSSASSIRLSSSSPSYRITLAGEHLHSKVPSSRCRPNSFDWIQIRWHFIAIRIILACLRREDSCKTTTIWHRLEGSAIVMRSFAFYSS